VRPLTGHPTRPNPFGDRIEVVPFDFEDRRKLTEHLRGTKTLYNTYWVRFPRGEVTFERAVANSEILVQAAVDAGVDRIVHVSITNPSEDSPFPYFRGKARVEQIIRESGLGYTLVRPTVIFGTEDILINNIAYILRRVPVFGIPGSGSYRFRPVAVEDMADICVRSGASEADEVIDAVGPETFTFEDLWGKETRSATPTWPFASQPTRHQTAQMLWSIRYRLLCWLLRLLVRYGLDEVDLETVVLHHQLKVLRRGGRRVLFTTADRAFLAAVARVLSRNRWKSFLVGPDTLARWHRDLLKRRSGPGSRPPGRPPLDPSIKHLILGWLGRTQGGGTSGSEGSS